jgi:hypothetical protein
MIKRIGEETEATDFLTATDWLIDVVMYLEAMVESGKGKEIPGEYAALAYQYLYTARSTANTMEKLLLQAYPNLEQGYSNLKQGN